MGEKATDRSFAGGEISPDMYGRVDLAKYQTGLALCRNAFVLPHGPVENRPGTEFVKAAKYSDGATPVRLIPFTFNFTQSMAIEAGPGYFRFHTQAGTLLCGSPAAYNAGTSYPQGSLVSYSGSNYYWSSPTASVAGTTPGTGSWYQMPADGTYEIPHPYASADIMNIHYVQSADTLTMVHPSYPVQALKRYGATDWRVSAPSFAVPTYCPTSCTAAATTPHAIVNSVVYQYCVTTIQVIDFQESIASNTATCAANDLSLLGNINTVSWVAPAGVTVARYYVYKYVNGIWGFIGQANAGTTSLIDNNINPNTAQTPPLTDPGFNDGAGAYPSAVTYFQQRKWFGGTNNAPQNVWATMTGTESNLTYTLPVQLNNRLSFKIAAREASGISHMVPVANLIMLTPSTEWRCTSTDGSGISAYNLYVQPQSYIGANNVQPVVVGNSVLFAQSRGSRIREMTYQYMSQAYVTNDLSVMAGHLFDYQQIYDMCFSKSPYPILHCVTSTGNLVSVTYVPDQQVAAWHHHDFSGFVQSVCCITEQPAGTVTSEDMLYLTVNRIINGTAVTYIERMHTRYFNTASDAWFVDCGATNALVGTYSVRPGVITLNIPGHGLSVSNSRYFTFSDTTLSGQYSVASVIDVNNITLATAQISQSVGTVNMTAAYQVSSVSGLTWLANMTVNILADGAPLPPQVVSAGGTLTLPYPVTKVVVGLPITAQVQPLPTAFQIDPGFGEALQKNVDQVWLRLYKTGGLSVGPDWINQTGVVQRAATDLPGTAPALVSGVVPVVLASGWSADANICIQQTDPLPFTLCAVASDTSMR